MLEDKLRATDWEATNEIIEEQVARESYLQWFKDNERVKRNMVNTGTIFFDRVFGKYSSNIGID